MPVQLVLRLEEERQDDGELSGMAGGGSGNEMGGGNQAGPEECNTLFLNCNFSLGSTSSERDVVNNNQNVVLHCRECLRRLGLIPWLHCCEKSQSHTSDAIALWKEWARIGAGPGPDWQQHPLLQPHFTALFALFFGCKMSDNNHERSRVQLAAQRQPAAAPPAAAPALRVAAQLPAASARPCY